MSRAEAQQVEQDRASDHYSVSEAVSAAAEAAYEEVAEDVEEMFENRDPVYLSSRNANPLLSEGRIELQAQEDAVDVRYVGEEYLGDPADRRTVSHQYFPINKNAMRTHVQDVYAPLAAAAEYLSTFPETEEEHVTEELDAIREQLSGPITAEDADTVLGIAASLHDEDETFLQRTVYTPEQSG